MAFREKSAWLVLATMLAAYGLYFALILARHPAGHDTLSMLWLFGGITLVQIIAVVVGATIISARTPREARARADERDRAIARRGAAAGYYVLMVGMVLVGVVMPFADTGVRIINAALFALVLAEAVRQGVILSSYRRGWHG